MAPFHTKRRSRWDIGRRSPRYNRTAPTTRQRRLYRRLAASCLCPFSYQIGGGQCGACGRFSHRHDIERARENRTLYLAREPTRHLMEQHGPALEYLSTL
jgi:hypothetical protein